MHSYAAACLLHSGGMRLFSSQALHCLCCFIRFWVTQILPLLSVWSTSAFLHQFTLSNFFVFFSLALQVSSCLSVFLVYAWFLKYSLFIKRKELWHKRDSISQGSQLDFNASYMCYVGYLKPFSFTTFSWARTWFSHIMVHSYV